jgi:Flp pilus assembly protein TadB
MTHQPSLSDNLIHAGGGTALLTVQLSALIPGLLPSLALLGVIAVLLVLPVIVLGLAVVVPIGSPWGLWRLATRSRRRRALEAMRLASPRTPPR